MKIAQIAPLYESVPPRYYGGTERVVSYLTEELVRMGHDVTLFASGDSVTSGRLKPQCRKALRLDENISDSMALHMLMAEEVFRCSRSFDFIHSHVDYLFFPVLRRMKTPSVTTLHGRLDLPGLGRLYEEFSDMPLTSISTSQRGPLPSAGWRGTVYHGLPEKLFSFHERHAGYLAFLGRICPEKRVDAAIEIAKRSGMPLKIAAKVDRVDREYFEVMIRPMLDHPLIEYIGEIGEAEKSEFLGSAAALLFPIEWPEPFGLVMIEAMACGTPVIARRCGSVPEILENGRTGFIVESLEEAVKAVRSLGRIKRQECRKVFETRFTARRMAAEYAALYREMIKSAEGMKNHERHHPGRRPVLHPGQLLAG